jgi:hypothetical protein
MAVFRVPRQLWNDDTGLRFDQLRANQSGIRRVGQYLPRGSSNPSDRNLFFVVRRGPCFHCTCVCYFEKLTMLFYRHYGFSDVEKQDLVRAVEAYKALRNEAPFRAWSAFGLHGGSRIRKLQNYLSFTTDSTPSYWLGEADHDGILPTVGDYIAQVRL